MPFNITVLYNNLPHDPRLQTDWGFACLVEGPDGTRLFDTGGKSDLLLQNMRILGLDPHAVDSVFISHFHKDHSGGLAGFLDVNPKVTVSLLKSFPDDIKATAREKSVLLIEIRKPIQLTPWTRSTGELGDKIREHALVLNTGRGAAVITGCAHPGIVEMVERAHDLLPGNIHLVMGGFHLRDASAEHIDATIDALQALGVQSIAPGHCSGDPAQAAFARAFGPAYSAGGLGWHISIPSAEL